MSVVVVAMTLPSLSRSWTVHAGVASFGVALLSIAVTVAVDGAVDGVVGDVAEVDVRLGAVVVAQRDDAGDGVLGTVRVLGLIEVGEGPVLDNRDGVVAGGQLGEGVGAVRVRRGGRNDQTGDPDNKLDNASEPITLDEKNPTKATSTSATFRTTPSRAPSTATTTATRRSTVTSPASSA